MPNDWSSFLSKSFSVSTPFHFFHFCVLEDLQSNTLEKGNEKSQLLTPAKEEGAPLEIANRIVMKRRSIPENCGIVARLENGNVWKTLIESVKDLVVESNFVFSKKGIALQAMDSSHVSMVDFVLEAGGFSHYQVDKDRALGLTIAAFATFLKCAAKDDAVTVSADDQSDTLNLLFEGVNRKAKFELKLMDIEAPMLAVPDTTYDAIVRMSAGEFQRVCKELKALGDAVQIEVTPEQIQFSLKGDLGSGCITCDRTTDDVLELEQKIEQAHAGKKKAQVAHSKGKSRQKRRKTEQGDEENQEENQQQQQEDAKDPSEAEVEEAEQEENPFADVPNGRPGKSNGGGGTSHKQHVTELSIEMEATTPPVKQTFALRYLDLFCKCATQPSLGGMVTLKFKDGCPFVCEYGLVPKGIGHLRYFLAPKIESEDGSS